MRKTSAALASLSLAALALTGCSVSTPNSFDGQVCDRPASTSGVDDSVTVSGEFGVSPKVEIAAPVHAEETSFTDLATGEGTPLTSATQAFSMDYALYNGETGEQIEQSSFSGDLSQVYNINSWVQSVPGIADALACATPGTRTLIAVAPGDSGNVASMVGADDVTAIAVIDVLDTTLARAEGSLQFNDARSLPTVVRAPDGRPGIIVPKDAAPTETVTQVLIKGDGAEITEDDAFVWTNYTAVDWASRSVVNTTWDTNPVASLQDLDPEVAASLAGHTVGSQLLVVVPGEAGAATAYVVDILGIPVLPEQ
ncbi:hypothetical protein ACWGJP_11190 [Microbacterium sp. NPDC055903]